ncbi:MAG TPA: bacteriohemerythrin [Steroidobacteraceae bacterium]|nr:bacteriohemerythrin [Steroidobacteraceae bacterium]
MAENYFPWDAKYALNVRQMDDEHQVLIAKMNELHNMHVAAQPFHAIEAALKDLAAYTRKHFSDEEEYMERIGYPRLRIHKGIHAQLLTRLDELLHEARAAHKLTDDVFAFFKMWLSAHICGIDMQYAEHAHGHAKVG